MSIVFEGAAVCATLEAYSPHRPARQVEPARACTCYCENDLPSNSNTESRDTAQAAIECWWEEAPVVRESRHDAPKREIVKQEGVCGVP
jgi:hypothetical protein